MTRDELIERLAERVGVPRHTAQVFLHACFDVVKSELRAGETVCLPGLGYWSPGKDADNRLVHVLHSASMPVPSRETAETDAVFDAQRFIPASALELEFAARPAGVDVAALVTDVRRAMGLLPEESKTGMAFDLHDVIATTDEIDMIDVTDEIDVIDGIDEMDLIDQIEVSGGIDEADESGMAFGTGMAGESALADVVETANDPDALLESEMEVDGYELQESSEAVAVGGDDEDPLSDSEVFHRNRDQLYHPPAEQSRRGLYVTAVVLTICMLAIVLYMLLDTGAQPDIPGTPAVGGVMAPSLRGCPLNT